MDDIVLMSIYILSDKPIQIQFFCTETNNIYNRTQNTEAVKEKEKSINIS